LSELAEIYVAAADDTLCRALREQKRHSGAWRIDVLDVAFGAPGDQAIVIVDFGDPADRDETLAALDAQGFGGAALVLGGAGEGWPDAEPLARPVRLGALIGRLEAHATPPADTAEMRLGPYDFVPSERILRHGASGEEVRLTELEQRLLGYLAAAGGFVDRDRLLDQVWGYRTGADTHTVETHVWRLRQKIETDDPATRFLVTEVGGYRIIVGDTGEAV